MKSYQREQLENYLANIDVKADRVLDIGGGQSPVAWIEGITQRSKCKSWDVKEFRVLDEPNPFYLEEIYFNNITDETKNKLVIQPDLSLDMNYDVTKHLSYNDRETIKEGFDIVFCLAMNLFVWDTVQFARNLNTLTKMGGFLYITNYFIQPVVMPTNKDMIRMTRDGIIKLLDIGGFEIEEIMPLNAKDEGITKMYDGQLMRYPKNYQFHNEVGQFIKARKNISL